MESNHVKYIHDSNFELMQTHQYFDWFSWSIVLVCLILVIVSRLSNYDYISKLFKRHNNFNSNANSLSKLSSILLIVNYYLVISLFIWQFIIELNVLTLNTYLLFGIVLVSLVSLSTFKIISIYMIDILFKRKNHFHIRYHLSFTQIIGILALPLYVFSFFLFPNQNLDLFLNVSIHKIDIYLFVLILFSLTILFREFKSLFTALNNRISLLYIILYLCTLEILPLILAIKILKG